MKRKNNSNNKNKIVYSAQDNESMLTITCNPYCSATSPIIAGGEGGRVGDGMRKGKDWEGERLRREEC